MKGRHHPAALGLGAAVRGARHARIRRPYVFSAKPAADLRPSAGALVVNIRYITRAPLRYEVKSCLFQGIVELMQNSDKVATA